MTYSYYSYITITLNMNAESFLVDPQLPPAQVRVVIHIVSMMEPSGSSVLREATTNHREWLLKVQSKREQKTQLH